ncbi:MAG: hypothetical protein R3297_04760 [Desulfobulbales bacterium]|nr:hypothetical protein [Desulfobulbales bacterium]
MDFHEKFTTMGIFKIKFYLSPEVGIVEKTIVILLMILLFVFLYNFLKSNAREFLNGFRKKKPYIITASAGLLSLPASKVLDGGLQWLDAIGQGHRAVYFEESLEMAIPLFFIIAMLQFYREESRKGVAG